MSITIGIDPGLHGAIALLDSYKQLIDVYDMPVVAGKISPQIIAQMEAWETDDYGTAVIEDVASMPKQGVVSVFGFGRSKGIVEGIFAMAGKPIVYVRPAKWKADLGISKEKEQARRRAIELWPSKATMFARVKDDGRAEAALIALWYLTNGDKSWQA